eukprot:Clim_evm39s202 gene=Clim_evmTU39s202
MNTQTPQERFMTKARDHAISTTLVTLLTMGTFLSWLFSDYTNPQLPPAFVVASENALSFLSLLLAGFVVVRSYTLGIFIPWLLSLQAVITLSVPVDSMESYWQTMTAGLVVTQVATNITMSTMIVILYLITQAEYLLFTIYGAPYALIGSLLVVISYCYPDHSTLIGLLLHTAVPEELLLRTSAGRTILAFMSGGSSTTTVNGGASGAVTGNDPFMSGLLSLSPSVARSPFVYVICLVVFHILQMVTLASVIGTSIAVLYTWFFLVFIMEELKMERRKAVGGMQMNSSHDDADGTTNEVGEQHLIDHDPTDPGSSARQAAAAVASQHAGLNNITNRGLRPMFMLPAPVGNLVEATLLPSLAFLDHVLQKFVQKRMIQLINTIGLDKGNAAAEMDAEMEAGSSRRAGGFTESTPAPEAAPVDFANDARRQAALRDLQSQPAAAIPSTGTTAAPAAMPTSDADLDEAAERRRQLAMQDLGRAVGGGPDSQ